MLNRTSYRCRYCQEPLEHTFVDLGLSPLCESYVPADQLGAPETLYPLHCYVCHKCFLVQLPEHVSPQAIFEEYAYFSSYSDSWLQHAETYVGQMSEQLGLNSSSLVIELASNDGYLLQYFGQRRIPVLGIEPAKNVAQTAIRKGIPTVTEFFGTSLARRLAAEGKQADLLLGNNVLAHVPDINDFVAGMKLLLKPEGVITMEFPHLLRLIEENQFDTIYHEHYSYLSFTTVDSIFRSQGLELFDVEKLASHGGSLRIYACHPGGRTKTERATALLQEEKEWGVTNLQRYADFTEQVKATKRDILQFLIGAKNEGKTIAGYGAPGKGNTLLNYCGIRSDFLEYTVDRNTYKQGKFTPGCRIPIYSPERIAETKPDYLFILPWNLKDEIMAQMTYIGEWGGRFIVPIPRIAIYD